MQLPMPWGSVFLKPVHRVHMRGGEGGAATRFKAAQVGVATEIWLALQGDSAKRWGEQGALLLWNLCRGGGASSSLTQTNRVYGFQKTATHGQYGHIVGIGVIYGNKAC